MTAKLIRPGEAEEVDRSWLERPVAERLEAVWFLTKQGLQWSEEDPAALRLQSSTVLLKRG